MKLFRIFAVFVVVSLVLGIGSAFNGQEYSQEVIAKNDNPVEEFETKEILKEESTEIVENNDSAPANEENSKTDNSFSAINQEKSTSGNKQNVNKSQPINNSKTKINTNTDTTNQNNQTQPVIEKPIEEKPAQVETKESPAIDNSTNDEKINSTFYSITKGRAEYETESGCTSAGLKIKNKELDSLLDWNEEHPDEQKKPVIGSVMCIIVMKDGKEHWFLHFLTHTNQNLDEELKNLYK